MTEKELKKSLWLSRSLRNSAESQKFHLLSCALMALGSVEKSKELRETSKKYSVCAGKCIQKAIELGFKPEVEQEKYNEDSGTN